MTVYKAFKDSSMTQGNTRYRFGHNTQTNKALVLRVSGIHACRTLAAAKKFYGGNTYIVECSVQEGDIGEEANGVIVTRALTPIRALSAQEVASLSSRQAATASIRAKTKASIKTKAKAKKKAPAAKKKVAKKKKATRRR